MKLICCLLFLFLIEIHNAKGRSNSPNSIRIHLKRVVPKMKKSHSAHARAKLHLKQSHPYNLATIAIGNPPQNLNVMFDTGYPYSWVLSKRYDMVDLQNMQMEKNHFLYNGQLSQDYKTIKEDPPVLYRYGTKWVFGFKMTENITIEGYSIITNITEVTWAEKYFPQSKMDGIISLQYHPRDGNIIREICDKAGKPRKFSFYLPLKKNFGELALGEEFREKYQQGHQVKYYNEANAGEWTVTLDSLSVLDQSGQAIQLGSQLTVQIDTSTPYIWGSKGSISKFKEKIRKELRNPNNDDLENLKVECSHHNLLPSLEFKFDGDSFILTGSDYISPMSDPQLCEILFKPDPEENWRIGEPFLRRHVTVFDMTDHKVGIIRSSD